MHRLRALAATLTLTCALTACGDTEDEPTVAPAPTSDATSAPTSAATGDDPLVAPEDETAREFLRRWVALINRMQSTGDTESYLAISGPDCVSCHQFARSVKEIYAAGGSISGGTETVRSIAREKPYQWLVTVEAEPTRYTEKSDGPTKTLDGGVLKSRVFVVEVDGNWIVAESETVG
ncbi:DUF6318 family protein [Nocardioides sambongensis]|uniref:DUF6318 family protein n=1 Tax=Nocardioides sambongensis TaxID=2589074 RepID=UPI00112D6793|nr:DUF6318 family protein [Nocardioides sambongensis]